MRREVKKRRQWRLFLARAHKTGSGRIVLKPLRKSKIPLVGHPHAAKSQDAICLKSVGELAGMNFIILPHGDLDIYVGEEIRADASKFVTGV